MPARDAQATIKVFHNPPFRFDLRPMQKGLTLMKCSPPNSGDRGVTQQTMKANDADISEESQRELALDDLKQSAQHELAAGVLKQTAQDLRRFHGAKSTLERELYLDAHRWATVNECSSFFGREIEQTITARDIEATAEQIGRIRARRRLTYPRLESPAPQLTGLDTYAVR